MVRPLNELQNIIGYNFKDENLLRVALTHSSTNDGFSYERLEFLGDRVLGLVIADLLFKKFPDEKEGDMAKRLSALVQGKTLAKLASRISLGDYVFFSEAEATAGGAQNEHILADVFESVIGAMYLDGGLVPCCDLISSQWENVLYAMKKPPQHPKTALQEWAQGKNLPLPEYSVASQDGPDHAPVFDVRLCVKGYDPVIAQGRSRAEAEKNAAFKFMKDIEG